MQFAIVAFYVDQWIFSDSPQSNLFHHILRIEQGLSSVTRLGNFWKVL